MREIPSINIPFYFFPLSIRFNIQFPFIEGQTVISCALDLPQNILQIL